MAYTTPSVFFPQMTSDNNGITIPYANLPGLTAENANAVAGDGREIIRALIEAIFNVFNNLPADSRPTGLNISKSNPVGSGLDQINQNYSISITYTYDTAEVILIPEPDTPQIQSVTFPSIA